MTGPDSKIVTRSEPVSNRLPAENAAVQLPSPLAWWPSWLFAAALALMLIGTGYALHGKPLAEKTAIALVMPIGGLWLVTTGRVLHLISRRRITGGKMVMCLWLLLSGCATRPLPDAINRWLENSVHSYNPTQGPGLDVAIVLGGGTSRGTWRAQASGAGDRIVLAAELFHLGYASQLVTTGEAVAGLPGAGDPSKETTELWTSLGIPRTEILKLGGRNTAGEMAQIKQAWSQFEGKRVGLVTSANHLPRAMRLARAQGLDMVPIAADVKSSSAPWNLLDFIPSATHLAGLASNQHEIMAYFVNR